MLPVLLAATVLAAAPGDTAVRVPGTTLRFGLGDSVLTARGFPPGKTSHQGPCRFFGLAGNATLETAGGTLTRAKFRVQDASPTEIGYVQDQLTAMGYHRVCERLDPGSSSCEWNGRALVKLDVSDGVITAVITRPDAATAADAGPAEAPGAARGGPTTPGAASPAQSAPMAPDTLAVPIPGRPNRYAAAVVKMAVPPAYPREAARLGLQGRVWVLATVETDGSVSAVAIQRGIPELNAAALEAVRGYRFQPRTRGGAPCRTRVLVPILFTLH